MDSVVAIEERDPELENSTVSAKEITSREHDESSSEEDSPVSCNHNTDENQNTKEEDSDPEVATGGKGKPTLSYIALISMAILSSPGQRMLLSEIYSWIAKNFPYYKYKDRSWRNSIRHNLSLNECFIKAGRSENGKGNYWTVHPANTTDFGQGDFRRRRARRRVRQCNEELERLRSGLLGMPGSNSSNKNLPDLTSSGDYYVPMTSTWAPKSVLASIFGQDVVLSPEEKNCMKRKRHYHHHRAAMNQSHFNFNQSSMASCVFQSSSCVPGSQGCATIISQEQADFMGLHPQASSSRQIQQVNRDHGTPGTWSSYPMQTSSEPLPQINSRSHNFVM